MDSIRGIVDSKNTYVMTSSLLHTARTRTQSLLASDSILITAHYPSQRQGHPPHPMILR